MISLEILLTVCQIILFMLVWRIWYQINISDPIINIFSLFSSLVCMILYRYSKEKFCLHHSQKLKGYYYDSLITQYYKLYVSHCKSSAGDERFTILSSILLSSVLLCNVLDIPSGLLHQ